MSELAQIVLSEPAVLLFASTVSAGFGWCLKKLYEIDNRLGRIEERCTIHFPKK